MTNIDKINKEVLETLCMLYDFTRSPRQGSFYEGKAIFDFYLELVDNGKRMTREEWIKKMMSMEVEKIKEGAEEG